MFINVILLSIRKLISLLYAYLISISSLDVTLIDFYFSFQPAPPLELPASSLTSLASALLARLHDTAAHRQTLDSLRSLCLSPSLPRAPAALALRLARALVRRHPTPVVASLPQPSRRALQDSLTHLVLAHPGPLLASAFARAGQELEPLSQSPSKSSEPGELSGVYGAGAPVLRGVCAFVDSEKDPRNLLGCFDLCTLVLQTAPDDLLVPFLVEIFENISCFFPITFSSSSSVRLLNKAIMHFSALDELNLNFYHRLIRC